MKLLKSRIGFAFALVLGMLVCGVAAATPVTMNFDGLTPGTAVSTYYAGGCSKALFFGFPTSTCVDSHGPNYGVKWQGAHVKSLGDEPSTPNYAGAGLFSDGSMTMNVAGGFDTGFYFYYTTFFKVFTGTVTVYSGENGHGTPMGQLDLSGTGIYCNGDIPCWLQTGLDFDGTAESVVFDGFSAALGLDNVTIGASLSVPEPATIGMFGLGLLLIGAFVGLRRRRTS